MIVVSDTSPLNYLVLIHAVNVLPDLFTQVFVPTQVMSELRRTKTPDIVKLWASTPPSWLQVRTPVLTVQTSIPLDPGETQAIALAKELKADAILIDERKGRAVAAQQGLLAIGTITVLELAASHNLLNLKTAFQALQQTTFHLSNELLQNALDRDAIRRRPGP